MFLPLQCHDINLANFRKFHYYYYFANSLSFLHSNIRKLRQLHCMYMVIYVCICVYVNVSLGNQESYLNIG